MRLKVAETFYSIQGEGSTVGRPSVFLRLSGCVLNCSFCDTTEVWKTGRHYDYDEFRSLILDGYGDQLQNGAHLILTGGDPLIQQDVFLNFWERLIQELEVTDSHIPMEVETEGCIIPREEFKRFVDNFNVSPKLANSEMPLQRRFKQETLEWHLDGPGSQCSIFKLVVSNEEEAVEGLELLQSAAKFPLDPSVIYFMPKCASRAEHDLVGPLVAELAKKHGVCYSPRLHLQLWDKTTGV